MRRDQVQEAIGPLPCDPEQKPTDYQGGPGGDDEVAEEGLHCAAGKVT